jgi:hypothetical protein
LRITGGSGKNGRQLLAIRFKQWAAKQKLEPPGGGSGIQEPEAGGRKLETGFNSGFSPQG